MVGRWSQDIIGGDTPLDILGDIGDRIEIDLYPLDLDDAIAGAARIALEALPADFFDDMAKTYDDEAFIVGAAVMLHAGAAMSDAFRVSTLQAIDRNLQEYAECLDADTVERRRAALLPLRQAVETAQRGQRYAIESEGLFDKIARANNGQPERETVLSVSPMSGVEPSP